jgi:hypothetical protein
VIAWFAILFTGRCARDLFAFVLGVGRWSVRVSACAFLLATGHYPPFSCAPSRLCDASSVSDEGTPRPSAI